MARTFGAPLTVPAGKMDLKASKRVLSGLKVPETWEVKCMTWENLSTVNNLSTFVVKGSQTLLMSFLAKSTSMTCSARSFNEDLSSRASSSSSSVVLPRLIVPAIGWVITLDLASALTNSSGEAPTIWKSK
ncbi:hypothetical protein WICPIJ_009183 [Wickerhamomyces pijperi]|uniref:Uncharacterized protein n=1 Tax=Wickerhamomyces pijperi TaxID=599730 RepID=A0A9P8PQ39_WICPI|nr:hypothetical protein WICPIJ_009183 [Wickerhamomyces pijperi]